MTTPERIEAIKEYRGQWPSGYGVEAGYQVVTDQQTITLAIDDEQSCCESWGYFLTEDEPEKFVGAELRGVKITDTNRSTKQFAPSFSGSDDPDQVWLEDGDVLFVDIETDRGPLQFVAYNSHNGYYGHTARVSSKQLTTDRVL